MTHFGVEFDEAEIEHIAVRAAEVADSRLEALCDEALRDGEVGDELSEQMLYNPDIVQWIEEGRHNGWRRRKVTP